MEMTKEQMVKLLQCLPVRHLAMLFDGDNVLFQTSRYSREDREIADAVYEALQGKVPDAMDHWEFARVAPDSMLEYVMGRNCG